MAPTPSQSCFGFPPWSIPRKLFGLLVQEQELVVAELQERVVAREGQAVKGDPAQVGVEVAETVSVELLAAADEVPAEEAALEVVVVRLAVEAVGQRVVEFPGFQVREVGDDFPHQQGFHWRDTPYAYYLIFLEF